MAFRYDLEIDKGLDFESDPFSYKQGNAVVPVTSVKAQIRSYAGADLMADFVPVIENDGTFRLTLSAAATANLPNGSMVSYDVIVTIGNDRKIRLVKGQIRVEGTITEL